MLLEFCWTSLIPFLSSVDLYHRVNGQRYPDAATSRAFINRNIETLGLDSGLSDDIAF